MIDFKEKANLIWKVADLLRGDYKQSDYGKIISLLHKLNQSFACKKVACISSMGRCHSDFQFVLVVIFVEKLDNCLFLFLMPQKNVSQLFRGYMPVNAHEFVIVHV